MKINKKQMAVSIALALTLITAPVTGISHDVFAEEEGTVSVEENTNPTEETVIPPEELTVPEEETTAPAEEMEVPAEEETVYVEEPQVTLKAQANPTEPSAAAVSTKPAVKKNLKKSKMKSVVLKHKKSYKKKIKDTISVSPAYGRTVQLYFYDSYKAKWILKKTYKTSNKRTAKVKITYPKLWRAYSSSKWKIVCPAYKSYAEVSKTVKISNKIVNAKAAVIMDAQTGKVLYAQNARKHLKIASMTKMVTMMVVDDKAKYSDKVTISSEAAQARKLSGGIGLAKGDQVLMQDLIHATLMESANDAATAAACGVSGSQSSFSKLMVAKARSLGATETTFQYAFGDWHCNTHSTAYDQALIGREFMTNPNYADLRSIVKKRTYKFTTLKNKRRFSISMGGMSTELIAKGRSIGIKSGYNPPAGYCYANAWMHNGKMYISIVMGASSSDRLVSAQKTLMKYGDYTVDHKGSKVTLK